MDKPSENVVSPFFPLTDEKKKHCMNIEDCDCVVVNDQAQLTDRNILFVMLT